MILHLDENTVHFLCARLHGVNGTKGSNIRGELQFFEDFQLRRRRVEISGLIYNVPDDGLHGLNIHTSRSTLPNCSDAGDHFNPTGVRTSPIYFTILYDYLICFTIFILNLILNCNIISGDFLIVQEKHGRHNTTADEWNSPNERHAGDLGNFESQSEPGWPYRYVYFYDYRLSLQAGEKTNIIGRTIAIHEGEDNFTDPDGFSGAIIACGVIEICSSIIICRIILWLRRNNWSS